MPKAKASSTAMVVWDKRLAELAATATKSVASLGGGGNFITLKSGQLSYQQNPVPGNRMTVVIIDSIIENKWTEGAYNPDSPKSPDCYAFGFDAKEMVPHPDAPNKQAESCEECPKHVYGSAERGKGMECSVNRQRVALITEGDLENLEGAEIAFVDLPYFSSKQYSGFVKQLNDVHHKPPLAFITEMTVVPDAKAQFLVKFEVKEEMEASPDVYEILWKHYEAVHATINFPYMVFDNSQEEEAPKRGKTFPARPAKPTAPGKPAARTSVKPPATPTKLSVKPPAGKTAVGMRKTAVAGRTAKY